MQEDDERERLQRALPDHEVGRVLGRGQFGVVWSARHLHLARVVAVKRLDDQVAANHEHATRFRREARTLAQLDHRHVVSVHDYREAEGLRLLLMELLDGGTLGDRRVGGMPIETAIASTMAAAAGLHHVHRAGVLHRDIKPENLMFDRAGVLKVTDFGLARGDDQNETAVELSQVGTFFGTPAYVAPEQAAASFATGWPPVSAASDQYSLAAVLYESLSGQFTHDATGGGVALCTRRMNEPARPLDVVSPSVPPAVASVVMKALDRNPGARFATTEEFAVELGDAATGSLGAGWLQRSEVEIRDPGPILESASTRHSAPPPPHVTPTPPRAPEPEQRRSGRGPMIAGVMAVVVLAVGAYWFLRPGGDGPEVAAGGSTTTISADAELPLEVNELWSTPIGGDVFASPAISGDLVIVGDRETGTLHALDAASGEARWTHETDGPISSSAAVDGDVTVVGSNDGSLHAVDTASGAPKWATPIGFEVASSPAISDDLVVVGADQLYGLERTSGEIRWRSPTDGVIISSPAVEGDLVVIGTDAGELIGANLSDGARRWTVELDGYVRSSPRIGGDTVYVGAESGQFVAVDTADGSIRWEADLGAAIKSSPWVDDQRVVVGTDSGDLVALDPTNGEELWSWQASRQLDSSPTVDDGRVVVGSNDSWVYVLDVETGELAGRFRTGGPVLSSPRTADGNVFVGSFDDKVYALSIVATP